MRVLPDQGRYVAAPQGHTPTDEGHTSSRAAAAAAEIISQESQQFNHDVTHAGLEPAEVLCLLNQLGNNSEHSSLCFNSENEGPGVN